MPESLWLYNYLPVERFLLSDFVTVTSRPEKDKKVVKISVTTGNFDTYNI